MSSQHHHQALNIIFFMVFAVDYIMSISVATSKLGYIFSFMGFSGFVSLVPILQEILPLTSPAQFQRGHFYMATLHWLGFLRFFRILSIFHFISVRNSMGPNVQPFDTTVAFQLNEITFQVAQLIVSIVVFIFLATGAVFAVAFYDSNSFTSDWPMNWSSCLYFVVVTGVLL